MLIIFLRPRGKQESVAKQLVHSFAGDMFCLVGEKNKFYYLTLNHYLQLPGFFLIINCTKNIKY
ncbi:hypothetical protein HOLleu_05043 [Holothuria leucospilota]|uniref:Uncharacterized protein n=1 Tax=Holothuria leucospilota TaxID=206669 RepID=A0A9Q1CKT9_HOLLE|nr:hypothetical protein HOLleu_05043 [Holothuria leucospilota]